MTDILFLKGEYREKIWGGDRLKKDFNLDIPSDKTGEYWAVSGMNGESSIITNGKYQGKTLREIYINHKQLFNNPKDEEFPLLIKLIDAKDDLSIQVHPDDKMAKEIENSKGKTECWYILNQEPASIIFGLNVKTKEQAIKLIDQKKWDKLLREIKTKKGDFFFVRAGSVHAIKKGSLILEIQQASDITYRLYDYDRKDEDGNLRDLHIEKSKEAIKIFDDQKPIKQYDKDKYKLRILTENEFFEVREIKIDGKAEFEKQKDYLIESVVEGAGKISIGSKSYEIKKGDFFIITNKVSGYQIEGKVTIVESNPV